MAGPRGAVPRRPRPGVAVSQRAHLRIGVTALAILAVLIGLIALAVVGLWMLGIFLRRRDKS
jgi:hypothetical protein